MKRPKGICDDIGGTELGAVRRKFAVFLSLLDKNNQVLELMSDMEEKSQGEYLFDINYIRQHLEKIRGSVTDIIDAMISLGGEEYTVLRSRFHEIDDVLNSVLPGNQPIVDDDFTVPFDRLKRSRIFSVGSKNAQLGEMKVILKLPVPEGFAITARAYKYFVDANSLQERISRRINSLDIKSFQDLVRVSEEIRDMIISSPVPENVAAQIMQSYEDLTAHSTTDRISMRSSAIGEDTLFSFAGQYASYLNVRRGDVLDRYREVLASKFTPQAIYYFLSHSLSEAELAMSVGCVSMIDAVASGVVYTRDPVNPDDETIISNAIFGLGKYLVNGTLTPDVFRLSRRDGSVIESNIAQKPVRLVMRADGGTIEEAVPEKMQFTSSLTETQLKTLVEYAVELEKHYRNPQDIEWAVDREGRLFLLQSRPLQVFSMRSDDGDIDVSQLTPLITGGTTVCPGAGAGQVHYVNSIGDLPEVPEDVVLVAPNPFPGLVTVMGKINALVIRVGGLASHMATIAREYHIPTLVGVSDAERLPAGMTVTVDATGRTVYEGKHDRLVETRRPEFDLFENSVIHRVLDRVLDLVSPLRLLHPADEDFLPQNCMTFHDITRYTHQKAMEEMFQCARTMEKKETFGYKLKSDIPLTMHVIYLDQDHQRPRRRKEVTEDDIAWTPMKPFWEGLKREGWPSHQAPTKSARSMSTVLTERRGNEFSESSYAVLTREYMILNLCMGYHLATIEAICTDETSKNYIQMQYKEGGASLDRRIRRIKLLTQILSRLGFVQLRKGDYLHSTLSYQDADSIADRLYMLGRLTIMTKQLDMALSSDAVAKWYTDDFMKKLGIR